MAINIQKYRYLNTCQFMQSITTDINLNHKCLTSIDFLLAKTETKVLHMRTSRDSVPLTVLVVR